MIPGQADAANPSLYEARALPLSEVWPLTSLNPEGDSVVEPGVASTPGHLGEESTQNGLCRIASTRRVDISDQDTTPAELAAFAGVPGLMQPRAQRRNGFAVEQRLCR